MQSSSPKPKMYLPGAIFTTVLALFLWSPLCVGAQSADFTLLREQVAAQPDDLSVGCVPLNRENDAILYNADVPFPLASVSKLLIFIEYADRLEAGKINWSEMVSVSTLERYNLPGTDRGAHDRFIEQYPIGTQAIQIYDVAVGMVQYSSNAASDYLLDWLAPVDWQGLYRRLSITQTDPPHSLTLIPLLMNNHEMGRATMNDVPNLSIGQGERYLDQYVDDRVWRDTEIAYRSGLGSQFPEWETQTAILEQHTALGTVRDFLQVLQVIYGSDEALSPGVKTIVRSALRWDENPFINENYVEYGSKLGFYSGGTLTLIAYGHPEGGEPVISAAFLRNIPRPIYRDFVEEDAIGNLTHWMNFNACEGLETLLP